MSGCNDSETFSFTNQTESNDSYRNKIQALVTDFNNSLPDGTRTNDTPIIGEIQTRYYCVNDDLVIEEIPTNGMQRISGIQPGTTVPGLGELFDITTAIIYTGEKKGYTICSTHPGINKAYFYTPEGVIADTISNPALGAIINMTPWVVAYEIKDKYNPIFPNTDPFTVGPLRNLKWGQGYPFNQYAPSCDCIKCYENNNLGHNPIGCSTTATAQAIAIAGKFKSTHYLSDGVTNLGFPSEVKNMSVSQMETISRFFHEIALGCQIEFSCNESKGQIFHSYQYLKDLGYSCNLSFDYMDPEELDIDKVFSNLKKGLPHIVGGSTGDFGHMWVLEGMKLKDATCSYYCNWGWYGSSNGWSDAHYYIAYDKDGNRLVFGLNLANLYINSK